MSDLDATIDPIRTWIETVLRPMIMKPVPAGATRNWSFSSNEAANVIRWLFGEVDFLKDAADNCMAERDEALAEVERLKAEIAEARRTIRSINYQRDLAAGDE